MSANNRNSPPPVLLHPGAALRGKEGAMRMNDASQATGVPASQDRNPLEGRLWQEGSLVLSPPASSARKKIPARLRHGGRKLAQPRRASPGNRGRRLPGSGRRAWRPLSTVHSESGLSICGQSHCRTSAKPRLVVIATSLPISAFGFRSKSVRRRCSRENFQVFSRRCAARSLQSQ